MIEPGLRKSDLVAEIFRAGIAGVAGDEATAATTRRSCRSCPPGSTRPHRT
jgi:hypothetical protein